MSGLKILHKYGKRVETKSQKVFEILGLIPTLAEVTEEKMVGGLSATSYPLSWIRLRKY